MAYSGSGRMAITPQSATLIALHGLSGDAFKTWTDKDNHLWLRDSLPEHIPNARIMTFGYDSALKNSTSRMTVLDFAQDLLIRLTIERQDPLEWERPIIFLCHSLGGIVAKQALIMSHIQDETYGTIVKSTTGMAFFGTPHRGSKTASTGRMLSRIVNAASLSRATIRSDLLKTLEISSQSLDHISRLSSQILSGMSIISFYEQKPLSSTGSLIVEQFSAILGFPNERAIPINSDHRGISRCSPRHPNLYLPVWSSLKEMVEKSLLESRGEYDEFMDKLFCVDYKTAQLRPRQPHHGTCDWIFHNPTFRDWLDSPQSAALLLSAPPGFGKTVLTRHVMEKVLAGEQMYSDGTCINLGVSFFCSYNDQISTSEQTVLRSLLHQLLQLHPRAQHVVCNGLLERKMLGLAYDFTPEKLWVAIRDVLSMDGMANTFICIDAIEELNTEDCHRIVAGFNDIVNNMNKTSKRTHRIRVFFSSRPSAQYRVNHPSMHILSVNRQHTEMDIRNYLRDSITEFCQTNAPFAEAMANRSPTSIIEKMTKRSDGMFLWATVAWENFCQHIFWNEDVLEERLLDLESTPPGINPLYNKLLDRIDPTYRKELWAFFAMIAVAKRPLSEAELSELLPVMVSQRDELTNPCQMRPFPKLLDIIEKHCRDFITVHDDGKILFCHLSFKEYLLQTWATDRPEILEKAKVSISKACLAYIKYWDSLTIQDGSWTSRIQLLDYAVSQYLSHLASLPSDHPLWITYAETADSGYFARDNTSPLHPLFTETFSRWISEKLMSIEKCHEVVRAVVSHGYDLNGKDKNTRGSILNFCCGGDGEGFKLTVPLLLDLGADPNLYPPGKDSNLKAALYKNHQDTAKVLLRHPKFDPNQTDRNGQSALHHLIGFSSDEAIFTLLENRVVEVNIQDRVGSTPLHLAVDRQRSEVVRRLLLAPHIRLDIIDKHGRTPLALATWWGLKQIALIIIERSEAFPIPENSHVSPLLSAAKHGEEEIVRVLLPKTRYKHIGRDLDESGKGFLHYATMNNWHDTIETCLMLSDINTDQIDHSGGTALHYGAKLGCTESCRALLKYEASTRLQDRNGRNAAQMAAEAGFKDTLELIVREGNVDANQRDHQGRNLVHWAATLDCLDVMQLICQQPGVDVARRDNSGKMPIAYAWSCQCPKVGRYLSLRMKYLATLSVPWKDPYNWDRVFEIATTQYMKAQLAAEEMRKASERAAQEETKKAAKLEERPRWEEAPDQYSDEQRRELSQAVPERMKLPWR
ncbi:hypothetical protein FSARC_3407 [Fusarium sarcochroum]|uniref:Nephrocystin 3-like N-terminal domain-containing protein n=1 Tax=Fusarium sarcochroum TaxID=1208366 RepID=A0A8H4XBW8_9HYPO|nr:hypothetical protein FSARC_3407 [Fusarium sarcochroum]